MPTNFFEKKNNFSVLVSKKINVVSIKHKIAFKISELMHSNLTNNQNLYS